MTSGLLWGPVIPQAKYPRIALSAHMNMLQHGLMSIAAGILLRQGEIMGLEKWQVFAVALPHYYVWLLDAVMIANSWWGTNKMLTLV